MRVEKSSLDRTSPAPEGALVRVRGLARDFGGRRAVGPVDLDLAAGQRMAIVGANGSGKSTILRCLAGTLVPTAGTIEIDGYAAGTRAARARVGVSLSQERSFELRLTGHVNLLLFGRLRGLGRRAARESVRRIEDELELGDVAAKRVANCSTGMTQQLAFARALLGEPRLLLLDEPTRSLDEDARERLWAALERRPDVSALIATHREDDVEHCEAILDLAR